MRCSSSSAGVSAHTVPRRLPHSLLAASAAISAILGGFAQAQQGVVAITSAPQYSFEFLDSKEAQLRAVSGGQYSIHAAASLNNKGSFDHRPATQPDALKSFYPVNVIPDPSIPDAEDLGIPLAVPAKLPKDTKWATDIKPFHAPGQPKVPINTSLVKQTVTTPADAAKNLEAFTTEARAQAKLSFWQPKDSVYIVDPAGTTTRVENPRQYFGGVNGGSRGPADPKAGTLLLDPVTYSDVHQGDILSGVLGFTKDEFQMQVNDPLGVAVSTTELGTDILGPSLGPLGGSFDNNLPLVMRLSVSLGPNTAPVVSFQFNPAFTFFNPDDPADVLSPGEIVSFVSQRFYAALTPGSNPGDEYTLADDISLIGYSGTATADMSTMTLDYASMQVAQAPEPAAITLLATGCLALLFMIRRRAVVKTA